MGFGQRALIALLVGVLAAAVPIVATTRRDCVAPEVAGDAPRYLLLTSGPAARELLCGPAGEEIRFERVASPAEASARIQDESVAGIVFDRAALEALPGGVAQDWLTTGSGRVLVGLQLTHSEVELRMNNPPRSPDSLLPGQRGESTDLRGRHYVARLHFKTYRGGTCGGRGTAVYPTQSVLGSWLLQMATPTGGCGFG